MRRRWVVLFEEHWGPDPEGSLEIEAGRFWLRSSARRAAVKMTNERRWNCFSPGASTWSFRVVEA